MDSGERDVRQNVIVERIQNVILWVDNASANPALRNQISMDVKKVV